MGRFLLSAGLLLTGFALPGCVGQTPAPSRANAYLVTFTATRTVDHTPLVSATVPVTLGGEGNVKTASRSPAENQPALPDFLVRLNRTRQAGVYELVTRASVRELARNKKGKLKGSKRYIGALVPTRLGETQVVSTDSDPVHLEARLERR